MSNEYFTRERRNENMKKVLESLGNLNLNFNSLMFAFVDIIQSTFINGALIGKSPEEKQAFNDSTVEMINALIVVLNEKKNSQIIDVIALTNLLMDAIESATQQAIDQKD